MLVIGLGPDQGIGVGMMLNSLVVQGQKVRCVTSQEGLQGLTLSKAEDRPGPAAQGIISWRTSQGNYPTTGHIPWRL